MKLLQTGSRILASRVGQAIVIAVTGILVARALGPTGQGHLSLTLLVIMLSAAVLNGGMGLAAVPPLRRGETTLARMLGAQAVWIAGVAAVVLLFALLLPHTGLATLAHRHLGWTSLSPLLTGLAILALLGFEIFFYDLLAEGKVVTGPVINLSRAFLHLGVVGLLILRGWLNLDGALAAYGLAQLYAVVMVGLLLRRWSLRMPKADPADQAPPLPQPLGKIVQRNLQRGWIGQVSAVASLLHLRLDQAIVSAFWGASVVGVYAVAVQAGEILWLLAGALSPVLVYTSAEPEESAARDLLAARAVRLSLVATATVAVPLALLAHPLITFFYGEAYAGSAAALQALLPGIVAFAPAAVLAGDFIGRGRPVWNAQASALTVLVNVITGLLLIPRLGAVGAAWASTIAYVVGAGVMLGRFHRASGLGWTEIFRLRRSDLRR